METYKDDYKTFNYIELSDAATIIDLDNRMLRCVSSDGIAEKHGVSLDKPGVEELFSERDKEIIRKYKNKRR